MSIKPPCIKCQLSDNSNGVYTCNGCRKSFCSSHIIDHTNELRNRFEEIINEYNSINDIFYFNKQKLINFEKELNEIKIQIDDNQKISKYSEYDLDEWMNRLKRLKIQLTEINQSNFKHEKKPIPQKFVIIYFSIVLIVVIAYYINAFWIIDTPLFENTKFIEIKGPIQLSEDGYVAEHNGLDYTDGLIRFDKTYSKGIHHIQLSLEKFSSLNTFIGIVEANTEQDISSLYGWFIDKSQVISNIPGENKIFSLLFRIWSFFRFTSSSDIKQGDVLQIKIDCINSIISFQNIRTNQNFELNIDREQSPLPWQFIINLSHYGDRIRLSK